MLRSRAAAALLTTLALGAGVGACGGSGAVGDVVPKSTPDLVPPNEVSLAPAAGSATGTNAATGATTSTSTDTTSTSSSATAITPTTPSSSATSTVAPAPSGSGTTAVTPSTGGGATPNTSTGTATGTTTTPSSSGGADAGGFSTFCKDNPGACPAGTTTP